jgi:hypothetical protein
MGRSAPRTGVFRTAEGPDSTLGERPIRPRGERCKADRLGRPDRTTPGDEEEPPAEPADEEKPAARSGARPRVQPKPGLAGGGTAEMRGEQN